MEQPKDRLLLFGSNHRIAPASELQALAKLREQAFGRVLQLQAEEEIAGGVLLATCNRIEILLDTTETCREDPAHFVLPPPPNLPRFEMRGKAVTHHLLRVVVGLESMAIGEDQIVGQLKRAFQHAEQNGLLSRRLRNLRNRLLKANREVREQSGLSRHRVSLAAVAAERLRGAGERIAVIGTGETGRLAAEALRRLGVRELFLVNRTLAPAHRLAAFLGCRAMSLAEFRAHPPELDGMLLAIKSPEPVLGPEHAKGCKLIIDVSMPSVVARGMRELEGLEFLDLDELANLPSPHAQRLAASLDLADRLTRARAARMHAELDPGLRSLQRVIEHHLQTALDAMQEELSGGLGHLCEADKERVRRLVLRSAKRQAHYHISDLKQAVPS